MPGMVGVIGILAVLAGLRLLWHGRQEIFFWLEIFVRILRNQLAQTGEAHRPPRWITEAPGERNTLRLVVGMFLVLVLGPFLIALGLVL